MRTPRLASSRLNWRPCRFKWTRAFRRKTKSGFCACAITFQKQSTYVGLREHHDCYTDWCVSFHCLLTLCTATSIATFTPDSSPPPFHISLLPLPEKYAWLHIVGIGTMPRAFRSGVQNQVRARQFSFLQKRADWFWDPPSHLLNGQSSSFPV